MCDAVVTIGDKNDDGGRHVLFIPETFEMLKITRKTFSGFDCNSRSSKTAKKVYEIFKFHCKSWSQKVAKDYPSRAVATSINEQKSYELQCK